MISASRRLTSNEAFVLSGGTLTLSTPSVFNDALTLSGGISSGPGMITVNGLFTWSGGTMNGAGSTDAKGGLQLTNAAGVSLADTRVLINSATATWTGAGNLSPAAGATFRNQPIGVVPAFGN
jgi:phage baseplate assembly protein gpV